MPTAVACVYATLPRLTGMLVKAPAEKGFLDMASSLCNSNVVRESIACGAGGSGAGGSGVGRRESITWSLGHEEAARLPIKRLSWPTLCRMIALSESMV